MSTTFGITRRSRLLPAELLPDGRCEPPAIGVRRRETGAELGQLGVAVGAEEFVDADAVAVIG